MDYREFADGRGTVVYPERKDAQQEALEQADAWSNFFERGLLHRLSTEANEPFDTVEAITAKLHDYEDWCNGPLQRLHESLMQHTTVRSRELLMYLNFHTMSDFFMQQWFRVLTGAEWDSRESRELNGETQDYLAIASLELQKRREALYRTQGPAAARTLNGILAEYDSAIVALGMPQTSPDLLLLPAPGTFEHSTEKQKNADFILLDLARREVVGAQVKTTVGEESFRRYDPRFVFLIDTATDLGDVISKKEPGKSTPTVVPRPGLIAAHHVRNWPKQMNMRSRPWLGRYISDERTLMGLKFYANTLTHGARDVSGEARERIGKRALHHLYHKPVKQDQDISSATV